MTATMTPITATIRLRQRKDGTWRGTLYGRLVHDPDKIDRWELRESSRTDDPDGLGRSLATSFAELMAVLRPNRRIEFETIRTPLSEAA